MRTRRPVSAGLAALALMLGSASALLALAPLDGGATAGESAAGTDPKESRVREAIEPSLPSVVDPAAVVTGGYVFTDLGVGAVGDPEEDHVAVFFRVGWATAVYPGTRMCSWSVFDPSGNLLGDEERKFESSATLPDFEELDSVLVEVTSGTPDKGGISCSEERLDDPTGHYEFTDVEVVDYTSTSAEVSFAFDWVGSGESTVVDCTLQVLSQAGAVLGTDRFTFAAEDSGAVSTNPELGSTSVVLAPLNQAPTSATLTCTPLGPNP